MKRAIWALGLVAAVASGCETTEPGAGSNTNWLKPCDADAPCAGLSCMCGVWSAPCDGSCPDLPNAVCAPFGSARQRALCGDNAPVSGMCLPACSAEAACDPGQFCSDGSCLQLASVDESTSGCVAGSRLTLSTAGVELEARYGTVFGAGLYLPVAYDERPAAWVEPTTPTPIVATVTGPDGAPVEACALRFIAGEGSGAAFVDSPTTDENGQVFAYWVAGDQREQSLAATLVDQQGAVASARVSGTAYANDEGPQSSDAAATVATRPATLRLGFDLPVTSNALRVVLSPATFPHHAFYSAVNIDGFFAGLQNTSDADALTNDVPGAERILLASVWNLAEGDAQQLYAMQGLECGPHAQELGGIRCTLGSAWLPGQAYVFELERTTLAQGEAGPDYDALGYLTDACESTLGCTDYTLWFGPSDSVDGLQRVLAYRYQSGAIASSFGSFLQPYLELAAQNSCLATPLYDAHFLPFVQNGANFEQVWEAGFSAAYASWHNEVCANYDSIPEPDGFRLVTGGPQPLGRPELSNDSVRLLTLP